MSKRVAAGRRVGFFKRLVEGNGVSEAEDDGVVEGRLEKSWGREFIGWREGRGRLVAAALPILYSIP